jgi:hypothetical protein
MVSNLSLLGRACFATTLSMAGCMPELFHDLFFALLIWVLIHARVAFSFHVENCWSHCFPHSRVRPAGGDFICQIILRGNNQQQQQRIQEYSQPSGVPGSPVAHVTPAAAAAAATAKSRPRLPVPVSAQVWLQVGGTLGNQLQHPEPLLALRHCHA